MVTESIVAYLKTKLSHIGTEEEFRALLNNTDIEIQYSSAEKVEIIQAIDSIKILDPACGSGAFPMGILHRLVFLLHKIDHDNTLWKKSILQRTPIEIRKDTEKMLEGKTSDYIRKLGLIQNCIYGLDLQPIAVEISKLRFFLSLLVGILKKAIILKIIGV